MSISQKSNRLSEAEVKLSIGDWLTEHGLQIFDERPNKDRPQWGMFKVGNINRGKKPDLVVCGDLAAAQTLRRNAYVAIEIKRGYKHRDILDGFDAILDYFSDYLWGAEYTIDGRVIEIAAFDLHPREVQDEVTTDIKVAISPSLKFTEIVEASLGTLDLAIQYKKLEPVIVGTGVLEPSPGWDFSRTKRQDVRGAKFLHLIIKRPKAVDAVRTTFELQAQVRIRQGILRSAIEQEARKHLAAVMCY